MSDAARQEDRSRTTRTILEQPYTLPSCGGGGGGRPASRASSRSTTAYVANEFGTIIEIAESPVVPGIYWAGTDDGNVQVSRDGGFTWTEVGKNIPGGNARVPRLGARSVVVRRGHGLRLARRPLGTTT